MKSRMPQHPDTWPSSPLVVRFLSDWLRTHLAPGLVPVVGLVDDRTQELFPEEIRSIEHAIIKRRSEFSSGRSFGRHALRQLGLDDTAIPMGNSRQPIWPPCVRGSITHCNDLCAVVVGQISDVAAVGLDLERTADVDDHLLRRISSPEELSRNHAQVADADIPGCLFSIKEAVFKAYFPETGVFLEFDDLALTLDGEQGRFVAEISNPDRPTLMGRRSIPGHFAVALGHVVSLVAIPPD
jgi:enterobactin synthetase component D / holo-[acyl-carrier protein] synthase